MILQLRRLGSHTLIYGLGSAFTSLIGFLLLPVFTNYLSPDDYGILAIIGVITSIVVPIFSLGFGSAIGALYFDGNNQKRKEVVIWTSFTLLSISTVFLALLSLTFENEVSEIAFRTTEYGQIITLALISCCFRVVSVPFPLYLQFEQKAKTFVVLSVLITLFSIFLDVVVVVGFRAGVYGMIGADIVIQAVRLVIYLFPTALSTKIHISKKACRELLYLGIPLIPSFAFLFVIQQTNKFFLERFQGLDAAGIYAVGLNLGTTISIAVSAFATAWTPYFMSYVEKKEEARLLFGRILTYYVLGMGSLCIIYFITAKPVVLLLTQPEFHDAYKVVGVTATAIFLNGVFSILLPGVYFAKEVRYITVVQLLASVVTIVLNFLLIPQFSVFGAALVYALGMLSMVGFLHWWNQRKKDMYLQVHYEWGRIIRFFVVYICFAVVTLWERTLPLGEEISFALVLVIFLVGAAYWILSKSERALLRQALKITRWLPLKAG